MTLRTFSRAGNAINLVFIQVKLVAPATAEQRLARKNELMARGTLLMALPDKHQLKFNIHKDVKSLMEAIEKRLHKFISQLEILGESLSQDDNNLKFLRSLPTEWRTHTLIWRNKIDLEDQSLDYLFNSLNSMRLSAVTSVFTASTKVLVSALPNMDTLSDAGILQESASHLRTPGIRRLKGGMFQWRLLLLKHWFYSVMVLEAIIGAFRQKKNQQTMPSWHSPPQVLPVLIMR
nr:hypothetical protein [Tanacetum cinerariifolium]